MKIECHTGLFSAFSIQCIPRRFKKALRMFIEPIDVSLVKVRLQFELVYIDDIVMFWKTTHAHTDHVGEVLTIIYDPGLTWNIRNY